VNFGTSKLEYLISLFPEKSSYDSNLLYKLATISYQSGNYSSADKLIKLAEPSSLTYLLQAKLAVREGNLEAALIFYQEVNKAHAALINTPAQSLEISEADLCHIKTEQALVYLKRGDFLKSMQTFYQAGNDYWLDIAYIAEKVLTLEELKTFVDSLPNTESKKPVTNKLRELLARRLLRNNEFEGTLEYFTKSKSKRIASRYINFYNDANKKTDKLSKAEALYKVAAISNHQGMEILAYEMFPDYAVYDGNHDLSRYLANKNDIKLSEIERVMQSYSASKKRYHYIYTATELALQSAVLLPHKSETYSAVLCNATKWIMNKDSVLAQEYYKLYLNNGAIFSWTADFGKKCPEPIF